MSGAPRDPAPVTWPHPNFPSGYQRARAPHPATCYSPLATGHVSPLPRLVSCGVIKSPQSVIPSFQGKPHVSNSTGWIYFLKCKKTGGSLTLFSVTHKNRRVGRFARQWGGKEEMQQQGKDKGKPDVSTLQRGPKDGLASQAIGILSA